MGKATPQMLVTGKLVALGFGVGRRTIWRWRLERDLPSVQVGTRWLFDLGAVEAWAREQGLTFSLPDQVLALGPAIV